MLLLLFSLIPGTSSLSCNPNSTITVNGPVFPNNRRDSSYGPNTFCRFRVLSVFFGRRALQVPAQFGRYTSLHIETNMTTRDTLIIEDASGFYYKYGRGYTMDPVSPLDLIVTLSASPDSHGYIQLAFLYENYQNKPRINYNIYPGSPGAFLTTSGLYESSAVVHCSESIVILMKAKDVQQSQQYYLSYTFIFDGEGTAGTYLGSLWKFGPQYLQYTLSSNKITMLAVAKVDIGIALVKPYSDVKDYTYSLDYAPPTSIPFLKYTSLDGRHKPAATTFYNEDEQNDFYLARITFNHGDRRGPGSVAWQPGDLRPNGQVVKQYFSNDTLVGSPQPISGRLNTFIVRDDVPSIEFVTSTPFDYEAMVTVSMDMSTEGAWFTVESSGNGPQSPVFTVNSPTPVVLVGTQFIFTYPQSPNGGAVALISFQKAPDSYVYHSTASRLGSLLFFPLQYLLFEYTNKVI